MGQEEILKQENFGKTTKKDLGNYYPYVYKCSKCDKYYGDVEEESKPYLCPICDKK